jgi:hypothetical protein
MKKAILLTVIFSFFMAFAVASAEEMEKEGASAITHGYSGTVHAFIPMTDKGSFVTLWEMMGIMTEDDGEGPFHNLSTRGIGLTFFEQGVGSSKGYYCLTDPEGDKIFLDFDASDLSLKPGVKKGSFRIIGGTGKFAGMEGAGESSYYSVKPAKEGTFQGIDHAKGKWKLPGGKK